MISAHHIRDTLETYLSGHPLEKAELADALDLVNSGADVTSRAEFRGHFTAGAILVDEEGRVLHIHHLALDKWLLPGGHLEAQDTTLQGAAWRELAEETGIPKELAVPVGTEPVHIDAHPIPANEAKGEAAHQHFDARFLFRTNVRDRLTLQEEEVTGYAWRPVDLLPEELCRRVTEALAR